MVSGQDGQDETEPPEAALECIELRVADPSRVGRVGAEEIDGNLLD